MDARACGWALAGYLQPASRVHPCGTRPRCPVVQRRLRYLAPRISRSLESVRTSRVFLGNALGSGKTVVARGFRASFTIAPTPCRAYCIPMLVCRLLPDITVKAPSANATGAGGSGCTLPRVLQSPDNLQFAWAWTALFRLPTVRLPAFRCSCSVSIRRGAFLPSRP